MFNCSKVGNIEPVESADANSTIRLQFPTYKYFFVVKISVVNNKKRF